MGSLFNFVGMGPLRFTTESPFDVLLRKPHLQAERDIVRVMKPQVSIVVEDPSAAAERQDPLLVREGVEAVMMTFCDLKRTMKSHPVEEISELAEPTTNPSSHLSSRKLEAFDISAPGNRRADTFPERERLSRPNVQAVDCGRSYCEIDDLVVLESGVAVSQSPTEQRLMLLDGEGEGRIVLMTSEVHPSEEIGEMTCHSQLSDSSVKENRMNLRETPLESHQREISFTTKRSWRQRCSDSR